jgi:hypothetical protein
MHATACFLGIDSTPMEDVDAELIGELLKKTRWLRVRCSI